MNDTLLFELVIPCFNESENLSKLISQSVDGAKREGFSSSSFQLVIVENGSQDRSLEHLESLKKTSLEDWFRVERLSINQGYGGGILFGLKSTSAVWIGFTHADLQTDPADAFVALKKCLSLRKKVLTKGVRSNRSGIDWIISRAYEFTVGITWGLWVWDLNAQPKVFHRDLLSSISNAPKGISFDAFIILRAKQLGFSLETFKVKYSKRLAGKSHWAQGFWKRIKTFRKVFEELKTTEVTISPR
jgi:glycosyltransferase involved in cell wall biosynthesis